MTSAEYLYDLRKRLRKLPQHEIDQAMLYYEEYFAEVGPEGTAELINRLGTPAEVASTIISDYAMKNMQENINTNNKSSGLKTMWIVILAVIASPIAIPIAIALAAVVFSVLISLFAVFFSLFVAGIALAISGVVMSVFSFVALFASPASAVAVLGMSLMCVSLGIALFLGTIKLCQLTIKGITWIFAKILGKKGAGNE